MKPSTFLMTACAFAVSTAFQPTFAQTAPPPADTPAQAAEKAPDSVVVTGKRARRVSKGATGLPLEVKDTPQSISTLDAQELADFGLSGSNEALALATGINVEQYETNRATFNARGFEVQSTQVDGLGMTNAWGTVVGREDTFLFDRIELIRGANGLLTGVGNASGTLNYVRKRPTNEDSTRVGVAAGSYNLRRATLDANRVLDEDGRWAGRLVVAHEDKDSHLRDLHDRRTSVYGVVDGQIGRDGVLTAGLTAVDARQNSPMWGSLTLMRADGTQAEFDVSASTSQKWTYWNTRSATAFIEYSHALSPDWEARFTAQHRHGEESTRLLYAYSPTGSLNADGTGLVGWPYRSEGDTDNQVLDANLSGRFSAFGRRHQLLVGVSRSHEKTAVDTYAVLNHMLDPLPAFPYDGNAYTEPQWDSRQPSTRGEQTLTRLYAASHWQLSDQVKAVVGAHAVQLERRGASIYGSAATNTTYPDTRKLSPYVGLTVDLTPDLLGYVSYSDIFQNQDQTDYDGKYLAAMKGVNTEVGLKAEWLGKRLLTTAAYFTARQEGLATYAGLNASGQYWYTPKDVKSEGFELEASGRLGEDARLTVGYTHLSLKGPDGADIYEWIPRDTLNLRVESRVPGLAALRVGLGGRWQSEVHKSGGAAQGAYAVFNAFGAYEVSPKATVRLHLNNLFNRQYITGLAYGAIYGAPRHGALSFEYKL